LPFFQRPPSAAAAVRSWLLHCLGPGPFWTEDYGMSVSPPARRGRQSAAFGDVFRDHFRATAPHRWCRPPIRLGSSSPLRAYCSPAHNLLFPLRRAIMKPQGCRCSTHSSARSARPSRCSPVDPGRHFNFSLNTSCQVLRTPHGGSPSIS